MIFCFSVINTTGITVEVPKNVSAIPGSCAVARCAFSSPGMINKLCVRWLKVNSDLDQLDAVIEYECNEYNQEFTGRYNSWNERVQFKGNPAKGDCSLFIKDVKKSDEGTYLFIVKIVSDFPVSTLGTGSSQLLLSVSGKPWITGHTNLVAGERANLKCTVTHSCPGDKLRLTWRHSDIIAILPDGKDKVDVVTIDPNTVSVSSVLEFIPSPVHHDEIVGCALQRRGINYSSGNITLEINQRPRKPTVNSSITVMEGSSFLLYCRSWGRPPVRLRWLKNGKNVSISSKSEVKKIISSASSADEGEYWCLAENKVGMVKTATRVSVEFEPRTEMSCSSTSNLTNCICNITAKPPANISWGTHADIVSEIEVSGWKGNDHMIQSSVNIKGTNGMGNTITCAARNKHGYHVSEYKLHTEGTWCGVINTITGLLGFGFVLSAVLITLKICRKKHKEAAGPTLNIAKDTKQLFKVTTSQPIGTEEVLYASIKFTSQKGKISAMN
ncbi:sialic acid-binding Ig-like lectin 13 isoform X2 [Narcine bancroftii]|uniref:sialic acid-binding Ig-like lectin 13 isoform X2 n=1 Tax=Narcine bancroftii TaxID=1343680 RepID=UPI00383131EC